MLPFSTLRALYRIPLIRNNSDAIHFLNDMFHLLIAVYRAGYKHHFIDLQRVFFEMIDSFAQYNHSEAKETVDMLLQIPWFKTHQYLLYRAIASYNSSLDMMRGQSCSDLPAELNLESHNTVKEFVTSVKILIQFNDKNELQISKLLEQPELMDEMFRNIMKPFNDNYEHPDYAVA